MKLPLLIAATVGSALFALDASAQDTTTSTTQTTTSPAPVVVVPAGPTATTTTTATVAPATTTTTPVTAQPTTTSGLLDTGTGAHPEDQPTTETSSPINRPLLITGTVLLGGTYAASAIDAAESGRYADHHYLYYPVVGPWMDLANRGCDASRPCNHETGNKVLLIADGIGQGIGALSMITSLFIPEKTTRNWILIGNEKVQAGPTMVGSGYGMGAVGTF